MCTVCRHPRRKEVNQRLIGGSPIREIAAEFVLSRAAVDRHKREHLPSSMVEARKAEDGAEASSLVQQLRALHRETLSVLHDAKKVQDSGVILRAITRLEKQLELEARLIGELSDGEPDTAVLISPEWTVIRSTLRLVLEPWPEALQACAAALAALTTPGAA